MSPGWVGFICGAFLGVNGGVILMGALVAASKRAEQETDEYKHFALMAEAHPTDGRDWMRGIGQELERVERTGGIARW